MELQPTHDLNHAKLQECFAQLQSMGMIPKSKMFKFYRNASLAFTELDKEFVTCRRNKRMTPKYSELERVFNECVTNFEQWSIVAALSY
jgi:hypothetical protein